MTNFSIYSQLYEEGSLPPQEIIEWMQYVIDTENEPDYSKYQKLREYCILEGLCYDVQIGDDL